MKKDKTKDVFLEQVRKVPIIHIGCEKSGVSRSSVYRWRNEDKEFRDKLERALAEGESLISDMSESQLISMIRDRNFPAIQLWLRTHHPKYANKVEVDGHLTYSDEELTPEQASVVKAALRLASFDKNDGKEK